jgi:hypothetical protein
MQFRGYNRYGEIEYKGLAMRDQIEGLAPGRVAIFWSLRCGRSYDGCIPMGAYNGAAGAFLAVNPRGEPR